MISKLNKVIKIIAHPKGGIAYILSKTRSISSFNINKNIAVVAPEIGTILDIGANIGQFAIAANKFFPNAEIHSFEPVPDTFQHLRKNTEAISKISIYNEAIGDSTGMIEFYQNTYSHASSALKVSDDQKTETPNTNSYKTIKVKVDKLDDFNFDKPIKGPVLLKLDVQGFEKHAIMGAVKFMKNVDFILIEVSFVHMYDGEPLFDEMNDLIKDLGFKLDRPVGLLSGKDERILQMDMFYKRTK